MWKRSLPLARTRYEQIRRFMHFLAASMEEFLQQLLRRPDKSGGQSTLGTA
jgi:hypothetical protein